jgi:hypothetical protein
MNAEFGLYQMFYILLACVSPCIWGGAFTVLYPFRRLTSYSWMVFSAVGILFLSSSVSACLNLAQLTGNFQPLDQMNLLYFWQGLDFVGRLATGLLAVGMWLSFRDLRDRLEMLTDIVEGRESPMPEGDFGRGF